MLIIIVLETKNKDGSDYVYFKSILSRFYKERGTGISIKPVFMNGKGNYANVESKIRELIKQYDGIHKVIYFFDIDNTNLKYDQKELNNDINEYCKSRNYEVVWYNKTIEDVLIGEVVTKDKTKIANKFFSTNRINSINEEFLNVSEFELITSKKSNVKYILDKYLIKK